MAVIRNLSLSVPRCQSIYRYQPPRVTTYSFRVIFQMFCNNTLNCRKLCRRIKIRIRRSICVNFAMIYFCHNCERSQDILLCRPATPYSFLFALSNPYLESLINFLAVIIHPVQIHFVKFHLKSVFPMKFFVTPSYTYLVDVFRSFVESVDNLLV